MCTYTSIYCTHKYSYCIDMFTSMCECDSSPPADRFTTYLIRILWQPRSYTSTSVECYVTHFLGLHRERIQMVMSLKLLYYSVHNLVSQSLVLYVLKVITFRMYFSGKFLIGRLNSLCRKGINGMWYFCEPQWTSINDVPRRHWVIATRITTLFLLLVQAEGITYSTTRNSDLKGKL